MNSRYQKRIAFIEIHAIVKTKFGTIIAIDL